MHYDVTSNFYATHLHPRQKGDLQNEKSKKFIHLLYITANKTFDQFWFQNIFLGNHQTQCLFGNSQSVFYCNAFVEVYMHGNTNYKKMKYHIGRYLMYNASILNTWCMRNLLVIHKVVWIIYSLSLKSFTLNSTSYILPPLPYTCSRTFLVPQQHKVMHSFVSFYDWCGIFTTAFLWHYRYCILNAINYLSPSTYAR